MVSNRYHRRIIDYILIRIQNFVMVRIKQQNIPRKQTVTAYFYPFITYKG